MKQIIKNIKTLKKLKIIVNLKDNKHLSYHAFYQHTNCNEYNHLHKKFFQIFLYIIFLMF